MSEANRTRWGGGIMKKTITIPIVRLASNQAHSNPSTYQNILYF